MVDFDLKEVICELGKKRIAFSTEADFKFSLAWAIKEKYKDASVICEYSPLYLSKVEMDKKPSRIHIDICVILESVIIPIELKYKTKKATLTDNVAESKILLSLANQSAQDNGYYGFVRDICRLHEFLLNGVDGVNVDKGYAVFLTNDQNYKKGKYAIDQIERIAGEKNKEFYAVGGNKYLDIPPKEKVKHEGWNEYSYYGEERDEFIYWLSTVK